MNNLFNLYKIIALNVKFVMVIFFLNSRIGNLANALMNEIHFL